MKYGPITDGLRDALVKRGTRVEIPPPGKERGVVNVFRDPADRYPVDTVYVDETGFTWGGTFQYNVPRHTALGKVADQVIASLSKEETL